MAGARSLILALCAIVLAGCFGTADTTAPPLSAPPARKFSGPEPTTPAPPTVSPRATPTRTLPSGASPAPSVSPATPTPTSGAFDPKAVELVLEPFASGLEPLTFLAHAADGSGVLYVLEQRGVIRLLEAGGALRGRPFLDVTERIRAGGERGLLGLAFHPDYAQNGRLFLNYTDRDGDTVLAEFARSAPGAADPGSERVLLTIRQPFANHNGGMLAFGPDGYLYMATGDGGGGGDPLRTGQDPSDLLGAILRIDVDDGDPYAIPADNPFAGGGSGAPEVWAWGLRNPWRFSFDRQSGAIYIADVGQGSWEEVNVSAADEGGQNYGWNAMEGPACFRRDECQTSGLTLPTAWYAREDGRCSVTGGYVYRGQAQPALVGAYLFADYCSGEVFALPAAAALRDAEVPIAVLHDSGLAVSSFGEDESGELYVVGHDGEVLRVGARQR